MEAAEAETTEAEAEAEVEVETEADLAAEEAANFSFCHPEPLVPSISRHKVSSFPNHFALLSASEFGMTSKIPHQFGEGFLYTSRLDSEKPSVLSGTEKTGYKVYDCITVQKKIQYTHQKQSMDLSQKIQVIKNLSLFADLEDKQLANIARLVLVKHITEHTVFIDQLSDSEAVYFITEGSVRVFRSTKDGQEVNLAILGPGEIVGEMALIDHEPRSASVSAIQNTTLLYLTALNFSEILKKYPEIATRLLATLSRKIRSLDNYLEEITTTNILERTEKTLKVLKQYFAHGEITLSHEELALIIGATRARVTEALDSLSSENKIRLNQRSIIIL